MVYRELEKEVKEIVDSLNWKWKLTGAVASFCAGVGFGAIGKHTREKYIPAIPVVVDLMAYPSPGGILCYSAGVAMNYIPEIYEFVQNSPMGNM